jgi:hypothetical protein
MLQVLRIILVLRQAALHRVACQYRRHPARARQHIEGRLRRHPERLVETILGVVFAVRRHRCIDGDDQRLKTAVPGAVDQLVGQLALFPDIELHPKSARGLLGDLLHRRHRAGGECERNLGLRRGLRQLQLAMIPAHAGDAGRCDCHRHADRLAEQRRRHRPVGHVDQRAMLQFQLFERGAVVAQCDLILGAAIEEFEHAPRQPLPRRLAQIEDVVAIVQPGHTRFPLLAHDGGSALCVNT